MKYALLFPVIALAYTAITGCNDGEKKMYKVGGRVTMNGDTMPAEGVVYFMPVNSQGNRGVGAFGTDGRFRVTTWKPNDGLQPGSYNILVHCWKEKPIGFGKGVSFVNRKYHNQDSAVSGLETVTISKATTDIAFDVSPPPQPETSLEQTTRK